MSGPPRAAPANAASSIGAMSDSPAPTGPVAPPPTEAQERLIERAAAVTRADDRILAAWLGGSFGNGTADAYSDVDLHCLVGDESVDWFREHWADLARQISPLVLATPIPGIIGGYTLTPQWLHLDLVIHPRSGFDPASAAGLRPLFDRTGDTLPPPAAPPRPGPGEPYFPAAAVDFYFYLLGNLAVVLGRGEIVLASNGAVMRRDVGLVPVMLAENGVHKTDGNKRLNVYLSGEQRSFLEGLPPVRAERESVIRFDRLVAVDLIRRGRALAERAGARWPAELEAATLGYLRRCLGVDFGRAPG